MAQLSNYVRLNSPRFYEMSSCSKLSWYTNDLIWSSRSVLPPFRTVRRKVVKKPHASAKLFQNELIPFSGTQRIPVQGLISVVKDLPMERR
mmetsp:Transcript_5035/g.21799  ORF Transcript_5035/g.21799 Transcript_5035/m.21799 type:complete len:91 (+) Transcript_5035:1962-2234(+)